MSLQLWERSFNDADIVRRVKRATMSLVLVLSACTIREARPNRVNLVDELTACLEQDPGWENLDGLDIHVGADVSPDSLAIEQCIQNKVNGAGLEARRQRDHHLVRIAWLKADAPADANEHTLSNGARVTIKQAWFTPPQRMSGPVPHFNLEGDTGFAIVKCRIPTTGHPEQCRVLKPIRGQELTGLIEQSVYSPCLMDGAPFDCDFAVRLVFKLAK